MILSEILKIKLEAWLWMLGLFYLMIINPETSTHFTICPLKNLGSNFCPGCGLGVSISKIFHFNLYDSFYAHPLGLPALLIILHRVFILLKLSFSSQFKVHN